MRLSWQWLRVPNGSSVAFATSKRLRRPNRQRVSNICAAKGIRRKKLPAYGWPHKLRIPVLFLDIGSAYRQLFLRITQRRFGHLRVCAETSAPVRAGAAARLYTAKRPARRP
ncbi:hypothetical protein, partial [Burkholderia pseudomallei]|uniref:hypothetical protein n=1 Tax=Burkholderia pseudomallei TaxID=28450 RepID=UPI001C4C8FEB